MRLDVKAVCLASAIIWGLTMLVTNTIYVLRPGYAYEFLSAVSSVYPGYFPGGLSGIALGTMYGFIDGALFGLLFAWLYNKLVTK